LDEETDYWRNERVFDYLFVAGCLCFLAAMEWYGYLMHMPRQPLVFSGMALVGGGVAGWRLWGVSNLNDDSYAWVVTASVAADGFNLDHVVIDLAIRVSQYSALSDEIRPRDLGL
jgi:hypothetical protein